MSLPIKIVNGGNGSQSVAEVTQQGQLVTAPIAYNETIGQSLTLDNVAFNFVEPMAGMRFVIDGAVLSAARTVSNTDGAVIDIYEASSATSTTVLRNIFTLNLARLTRQDLSSLNIITDAGVWINAKTDDATVNVTLLGYYVRDFI